MLYSVFYKIENRDKFFSRFCKRYIKTTDESLYESIVDTNEELMELIVKMILDEDQENLMCLLAKQNSKNARIFFDYFTGSKTKHLKKLDIVKAVAAYFKKEKRMKDISEFMCERVKPIKLTEFKYVPFKLTEADDEPDFGETPDADAGDFGDDAAPADDAAFGDDSSFGDDGGFGGDDGGFGGDGGDPFAEEGDENIDGSQNNDEPNEDDPYDLANHEDDPDFANNQKKGELGEPVPNGACVLDVDGIMKSLNAVIEALPDIELAEIDAVKKVITIVFNGKLLKDEDVIFQNPKNATYLLKKVGENVDERTYRYLVLKIKQALTKLRDARKEELAKMKNDTQNVRNTLADIDK